MGYTTEFEGEFKLDRPLEKHHAAYLMKFADTRRMKRDPRMAAKLPDPVREAVGLELGIEAEFFVGGAGDFGQARDESILNYNIEPYTQPGLWCKWEPNDDGTAIRWNGVEKFYNYIDWLQYLITNFLKPWGYELNGEVTWQGEDPTDSGTITVKQNKISI